MDKLLKDYLKTQNNHLNILSNYLPNSVLALSDIKITSDEIINKINISSSYINTNKEKFEHNTLDLMKNKHHKINEIKDEINIQINKNNTKLSNDISILNSKLRELRQTNKERFVYFNEKKKASSKNIQGLFAKERNVLQEKNNKLKVVLKGQKDNYYFALDKIYDDELKQTNSINNHYSGLLEDYHRINKKRLRQQAERVNVQQEQKDEFLNFQKSDLIDARQNYYRTLNALNNKINEIQTTYKNITNENKDYFNLRKEKTNEQLTNFTTYTSKNNQEILNNFENYLKEIDTLVEDLKKQLIEEENKLTTKYNRIVTSINVKFYQEKELQENKLKEINELNKTEISEIKKNIDKLEKDNYKTHKKAQKEYIKNLKDLTKLYTNELTIKRHLLLLEDHNKANSILVNNKLLSLHESFSLLQTQLYSKHKDLTKNIITKAQTLELNPLEIQSSLANYIYTTESQFYYQDLNDINENFINQINIIEQRSLSRELVLLRSKERIEINNQSELKLNELNHFFDMEFEKNKKSYLSSIVDYKMKINEKEYDYQSLKNKHKQELLIVRNHQEIKMINAIFNIEKEKHDLEIVLLRDKYQYDNLQKQQQLQNSINRETIKSNVKQFENQLNYTKESLLENKKSINLLYNLIKKASLSISFKNKDKLTPELLRNQTEVFKNNKKLLNYFINESFNEAINYYKGQLNDLSEKKHKHAFEVLTNDFNRKELNTNKNLSIVTRQLNHYILDQANILNNIQQLNVENKSLVKTINKINDDYKRSKNNNVSHDSFILNIASKQKKINKNKENIRLYKLQYKQIQKRMNVFENQISSLNKQKENLNLSRLQKENKLKKDINQESKKYFKAIKNINSNKNTLLEQQNILSNYFNELINSQLESLDLFKKHSIKFNKTLTQSQSKVNDVFTFLFNKINEHHQNVTMNEEKELLKLNRSFDKSLVNCKKEYKNTKYKTETNIKNLNRHLQKTIKLFNLSLNKNIKAVKTKQRHELLKISSDKNLLNKKLKQLDVDYLLFIKAFNLNKQQALQIESNNLKELLKESEAKNNRLFQRSQQEIKDILTEINDFSRRRGIQLNYISSNDKTNRNRLLKKQISITKQLENDINNLNNLKLKQINFIRKNRLKLQKNKLRIKNMYNRKLKRKLFIKKLMLPLKIKKQQTKAVKAIKKA